MEISKILAGFAAALCLSGAAFAQDGQVILEDMPLPEVTAPEVEGEDAELADKPDYSRLTKQAERQVRLDGLFARLQQSENADDAGLIAEDIWAIWLESGSASVNLVLRRGSDAQKKGKPALARTMYNHTTALSPEFAEGWARSARLSLEEQDFSRALVESTRALVIEPRHFYALWTMGNVFEQLGRQDDALEAYREANKLYPELKAVKDRLEALEGELGGQVL